MSIKPTSESDSVSIQHELQAKIEKEIVQKLLIQDLFNKGIVLSSKEVFPGIGVHPKAHSSEIPFRLGPALKRASNGSKEAIDVIEKYIRIFNNFSDNATKIYSKVIFVNGENGEQNKIEAAKRIAEQCFNELKHQTVNEINQFTSTHKPLSPIFFAALNKKVSASTPSPLRRLSPSFGPLGEPFKSVGRAARRQDSATATAAVAAAAAAAPAKARREFDSRRSPVLLPTPAGTQVPTFALLPPAVGQAREVSSTGVSIFKSATVTATAAPAKARRAFDSHRSPVLMPTPAGTQLPTFPLLPPAATASSMNAYQMVEMEGEFAFHSSRRLINHFVNSTLFPPLRPSRQMTAAEQAAAAPAPGMRNPYYNVGTTYTASTTFPNPLVPIHRSHSVPDTLSDFNKQMARRVVNLELYRTVMQPILNPPPTPDINVKK